MKKQRCGTGDSGCCGPAMDHSSCSMCHGVFAPVCEPEICNVPRIPHHQKLVEGTGCILASESQQRIIFNILVEREMQVYKGVFKAQDSENDITICADVLKFFEGDGKTYMLAIFHEKMTNRDVIVTIYQEDQEHQGHEGQEGHQVHQEYQAHQEHQEHQGHCQEPTQVFIYSTSMEASPTNLWGELVAGHIKFYVDHNVHAH